MRKEFEGRKARVAFRFVNRKDAISTENRGSIHCLWQLMYDEKKLIKKGESIIKLTFYSVKERIERRVRGTGDERGDDARRIGEERGGI